MWGRFLHGVIVVLGAWLGFLMSASFQHDMLGFLIPGLELGTIPGQGIIFTALFAIVFHYVSKFGWQVGNHWRRKSAERLRSMSFADLAIGTFGLMVGLLVAALLSPTWEIFGASGAWLGAFVSLILGFSGARVAWTKRTDVLQWFSSRRTLAATMPEDTFSMKEHKILDTSVIIDGRIADICKTGFIEGTLVIPEFVLEELQHIADSSDVLKRNRGRRGLDILNKIQKDLDVKVLIYEGDYEEVAEVDSKLVKLAKALQGKVVTNDFNLNKVCELQGVAVLNINDLANAVKPVVLPGEEIVVQVIKDGKENGQGIAYLDDGTMIVVEAGRDFIGITVEVLVTSVLQTSAGRMIFAKPKLLEKAL